MKTENQSIRRQPSRDKLQKSTADELLLLPPASLGYNGNNGTVKPPSSGPQTLRADVKTNGVQMVLNRRISGLVGGTSRSKTQSTGQNAPSQLQAATNGTHTRGPPPLSSNIGQDNMPKDAASSAQTSATRIQEYPALAAKLSSEDIQQESRSKGMLSGLHRKGSKLLRRARGGSKSDTELAEARPSPTFSPILPTLPSSPPAPLTLSPMFSVKGAMGTPGPSALLKGASMTNLSIPESVSAPSSPRVSGSRTPTSLMSPKASKRMDELMKAFVTLDKDHERYIVLRSDMISY